MGSVSAYNQQQSRSVDLTFSSIVGPEYEIVYVVTASPTQSGCGAMYVKADTSTVEMQ